MGTNLLSRNGARREVQRREDPSVPIHLHKREREDLRCHLCGRWPRKRCYVWSCEGDTLTGSCQRPRHRPPWRGWNPDEYLDWQHEPDCPMPDLMEKFYALPDEVKAAMREEVLRRGNRN